jgi:hypothetical protein
MQGDLSPFGQAAGRLCGVRSRALFAAVVAIASVVVAPHRVFAQENVGQTSAPGTPQQQQPQWMLRGLPGSGHNALEPLAGTWRVQMSIYATFGRSPAEPPIVSDDIICRRGWVAGGRYLEDTTEGTLAGGRYWRRGWLGYSNMDRRYEWVTIDAVNTTMMSYAGAPGSASETPISMSGVFTDQGVASEETVGKPVGMRTVIKIESNDRHVFELYFTPPGKQEALATVGIYTRVDK